MRVSSRTPEGFPLKCPICGASAKLEFSQPSGDATCPNCGHLVWSSDRVVEVVQRILGVPSEGEAAEALMESFVTHQLGVDKDKITLETSFVADLGADSLDTVELVMELEEEFDIDIPDEDADQLQTIEDVIQYIIRRQREQDG